MDHNKLGQSCNCRKSLSYYQMESEKVKIILDPGHGGEDIGEKLDDLFEKDINLVYALKVGDLLKQEGFEVLYTRETDVFVTEEEKRQLVDDSDADLFVSLHRTSNISHMEQPGVEAIVIEPNEIEMTAAKHITKELENIGFINLGVIRARGYSAEIVNYEIPQVTLLTGIYQDGRHNLDYELNFEEIIEATAKGITDAFQVQAQSNDEPNKFMVQVNRYRSYMEAQNLQLLLLMKGFKAEVMKEKEYYCVCCGEYEDLDKAVDVERYFKNERYHAMIIKSRN